MSEPETVRAVVDSNLLVRGVLGRHPRAYGVRLLESWLQDRFELVTSDYLLDEVRRALQRPKVRALAPTMSVRALNDAVTRIRDAAEYVAGDFEVDLVPLDVKDNAVLACALEGDAGYVVTDDRKHLLPLKVVRVAGYRLVRVVDAALFLDLLRRGTA